MTILASSALCGLQAQVPALDKTHFQQGEPRLVLVELFTSEGCSSCPPADALLRQMNGMQTDSGQLIVGISEHVTYWNDLGWSDPFSSDAYTQRQYAYGQRFHLKGVYTPQIVVDGEVQITGSDRTGLLRAIHEDQMSQPVSVHINAINTRDHALTIDFSVAGHIPKGGAYLFAAITDDNTRSSVTSGENSGHTLTHVSVAQSITRIAKLDSPTEQTIQIPLPTLTAFSTHQGRHLILFAQLPKLGPILGVDRKGF
jgi:hypothetical protein